MENIEVDVEILEEFERGLDPRHPERGSVPAKVLGYGEISTVFEIEGRGMEGYAFKRLPIFQTQDEVNSYRSTYLEYNRLLEEEVGIALPAYGCVDFVSDSGRPVFFIVQEKLSAQSLGNRAIHELRSGDAINMVVAILREMKKMWEYNAGQDEVEIAVDGQVSNWCIAGYDPRNPSVSGDGFLYVDTSTPLFRIRGVEQINPELFLRSAPSFAASILKRLFLADVVNRYYDPRRVVIDLIANFNKEQKPELIPDLIDAANRFFVADAAFLSLEPISEKDVRSYYREDALIWVLYLNARRIDRFLRTRLLRCEYPYILPGKIKR
jgi:hypothetical protein